MTHENPNPFVVAAVVVFVYRGHSNSREVGNNTHVVDKVRANGNFTLQGSAQQYRPRFDSAFLSRPGDGRWIADATSAEKYAVNTAHLEIFDDKIKAEQAACAAQSARLVRLRRLGEQLSTLRSATITEAQLDALEAAMKIAEQSSS